MGLADQRPLTSDTDLLAMHKAAFFVVQSYKVRGFDARRVRNRLQVLMDRSRKAGLWTADQYTLAASIYIDAIYRLFGERLTFDVAAE